MLSKRNITECVFANLVAKWWPCIKNNFNRENRLGRNEDVQVANLCTEKKKIEILFWMNWGYVRFGPQSREDTKYQRETVARWWHKPCICLSLSLRKFHGFKKITGGVGGGVGGWRERNPDNNKECCVKLQMNTSHIYNDMEKQYRIK